MRTRAAAAVTTLWVIFGIPVLTVFIPTLEVGIILASIVLYLPATNTISLTIDLHYWLVFLCIVLAVPGILLAFTQKASILCCVFIGTYTTILPIGALTCLSLHLSIIKTWISTDFFLGTNLRYISINVLRRATEKGFSEALILPPLQVRWL